MEKIAVVGCGVVGEAVAAGFEWVGSRPVTRVDPKTRPGSHLEDAAKADFIFVCVPTPTEQSGRQDLSAVDSVVEGLKLLGAKGLVVVKSTVNPSATAVLCKHYGVVMNPEFLTAREALKDFIRQETIVIGASPKIHGLSLCDLYRRYFPAAKMDLVSPVEASLVKYAKNVSWAVKVAVMNELAALGRVVGADWERVKAALLNDPRVAPEHVSVPGPDGKRGFGGACFPKDLQAFASLCEELGLPANVTRGAWKTNAQVRDERELFERWP